MPELAGLLTAMVTPFDADGGVDEEAAVALGRHLLANGSDGLVVCGTTGEAATLTDEEQLRLMALIVAELGDDALIVASTGSNDTRHAIHLTERAVADGAHAILSVTPYYNKPNRRGIHAHFEAVAKAAAGTPVIVYNIPSRTATNLPPDVLAELGQIEGIEGVKESNNDQAGIVDGLKLFAGNDDLLVRVLELGGAGGICVSSHVAGPQMRRLFDAPPDRRAALDAELHGIYAAMFCTSNPAPVKAALTMLGHRVGGLRLPLVPCDEAEEAVVRDAMQAAGLLTETTS